MTQERHFAHGKNSYEDCTCPAMTVGYNPKNNEDVRYVANEYDSIMGERSSNGYLGVVPEEEAQEAWLKALENIRHRLKDSDPAIEIGERIAEELGWL